MAFRPLRKRNQAQRPAEHDASDDDFEERLSQVEAPVPKDLKLYRRHIKDHPKNEDELQQYPTLLDHSRFDFEGQRICQLKCWRCVASLPDRTRCQEISCRTLPVCPFHLRTLMHLEVKPAGVKGDGLFACHPDADPTDPVFRKGDLVGTYFGERMPMEDKAKRYGYHVGPYVMGSNTTSEAFDAACLRSYASIINHSAKPNVAFVLVDPGTTEHAYIVLRATKQIKHGQELLANYGPRFEQAIHMAHPKAVPPPERRGQSVFRQNVDVTDVLPMGHFATVPSSPPAPASPGMFEAVGFRDHRPTTGLRLMPLGKRPPNTTPGSRSSRPPSSSGSKFAALPRTDETG